MELDGARWLYGVYPGLFAVSGYMVFRYAPVQDRNKPLDELERTRYRKRSRVVWGAETAIGMVCFCLKIRQGLTVAVSHLILAAVLALGLSKNRRGV